jgi:hypothetical protein
MVKSFSRKRGKLTGELPSIPSNRVINHRVDKKIAYKNIGPGTYNPSYEFVKAKGNTVTKFSLNKVKREVYSSNADYPGPGQYEQHTNKQTNPKHSIFYFHIIANGSSSFISSVPKLGKDKSKNEVETLRGPGYYDTSIK